MSALHLLHLPLSWVAVATSTSSLARSLALLPPQPSPHLSYARTNRLFIWIAIFPLSLTVSGGRWGKAAGSSAPMLVPCSPAEEASEGKHKAPSKSALCPVQMGPASDQRRCSADAFS